MQKSTLVHTVCLHRVRLQSPNGDSSSKREIMAQCATLEPVVVFTENDISNSRSSSGGTERERSIIEQCGSLRSLLGWFCGSFLVRRGEAAAQRFKAYVRPDLELVGSTALVAEEGLFVQVPSPQFAAECMHSASRGRAMDVIYYNSLGSRWCRENDGFGEINDGSSAQHDGNDEGYVYGFAQLVGVGRATEGLLLAAFSSAPLFNVLRAVVLEAVPHVMCAAKEVFSDRDIVHDEEEHRAIAAVYANAMSPLAALVDTREDTCSSLAGRQITLRFPRKSVSILRPDDLHRPFINVPLSILLLSFSYDALRVIHSLLLQEKRVVFIGATPQHASACVVSVQAMLVPFLWTLPIVPYLPPEVCDVLEAVGDSGFLVGSTADIVPRLMLHGGLSDSPQRGGAWSMEDEKCRIWFADSRTGVVGVSPRDTDRFPFTVLDLMPPSEKVKEAVKRAVSKEQRHMFRVGLASAAAQATGSFPSCPSTLTPCPTTVIVEEVHGAFLEYNVHRLVGNYRKGMLPACTSSSGSGANVSRLHGGSAITIDYTRFLPGNLDNNVILARCIAGTRMYRHWEDAVLSLETIGLLRSLLGEFLRSRARSQQRGSNSSSLEEKDSLVMHYYISHPRMIGMLCHLYIRSARRFPELYTDLQGSGIMRLSEGTGISYAGGCDLKTPTSAGGVGNSSSSSNGKGLMRTLFSKATKAVKNSLATHYHRIPVQAFVQAYGSFANQTDYGKEANKPETLNKEFKNSASVAATLVPVKQQDQAMTPPTPSNFSVCEAEDDLYGACSTLADEMEEGDAPRRLATSVDEKTPSVLCRRLPLDIIHQFGRYHLLLDPRKHSVYSTGRRSETTQELSRQQMETFVEFGPLLASESRIWAAINAKQCALLSVPPSLTEHKKHQQPLQPQQLYQTCPPGLVGSMTNVCDIPFEAQPLPFSMDLVTSAPVLPPPADGFRPLETTEFASDVLRSKSAVRNCQNSAGGDVMNDLFAFAEPQSESTVAGTNIPKQLEDFFQ
ncbi:hypothetical protein DQ04_01971060 [Trypanosoma grayi]|uniref:hypothetical protein n=1 Tax=Trypanosoma grayi TaxID=71804 RepID=UPI0004F41AE5|nr:hypothetical protein DQ04_01971060 [Trypanosoma grayi]KEG12134.1 hypothetical protein DQ04_01971060 [Trypanosoma grayi]